jgi:hypothetical protein
VVLLGILRALVKYNYGSKVLSWESSSRSEVGHTALKNYVSSLLFSLDLSLRMCGTGMYSVVGCNPQFCNSQLYNPQFDPQFGLGRASRSSSNNRTCTYHLSKPAQ